MKVVTKLAATVMVTSLFFSLLPAIDATAAEETNTYVTIEEFAEKVAKEIDVTAVNGSFVDGLIGIGIIKAGEFSSYDTDITRGDAMVLLNRADEYLNGTQVSSELVQTAIDKRISDIAKVSEGKRVDVAKAYLKGFMKGYSNGAYCMDRELKVTKKITKEGALSCIAMLKDKSKRAKISPDGQLIRTKNLPVMAKKYPYILESFPNEYYDWKFTYEGVSRYVNNKEVELVDGVDYAAPVEVNKITEFGDMATLRSERMDKWINDAKVYLNNILNVDYRTIDDAWIDRVIETNDAFRYAPNMWRISLERYMKMMKENKTILECKQVDIDPSSLYFFDGLYLRVHVKFRVVSTEVPLNMAADTLHESEAHNSILFSPYFVNMRQKQFGIWQDGYYEVKISEYKEISGSLVEFNDAIYQSKKVTK